MSVDRGAIRVLMSIGCSRSEDGLVHYLRLNAPAAAWWDVRNGVVPRGPQGTSSRFLADPDLRHRHPEGLEFIALSHHLIGHLGVENGGVVDNDDFDATQPLRTPDRAPLGVSTDVLGPAIGLPRM